MLPLIIILPKNGVGHAGCMHALWIFFCCSQSNVCRNILSTALLIFKKNLLLEINYCFWFKWNKSSNGACSIFDLTCYCSSS